MVYVKCPTKFLSQPTWWINRPGKLFAKTGFGWIINAVRVSPEGYMGESLATHSRSRNILPIRWRSMQSKLFFTRNCITEKLNNMKGLIYLSSLVFVETMNFKSYLNKTFILLNRNFTKLLYRYEAIVKLSERIRKSHIVIFYFYLFLWYHFYYIYVGILILLYVIKTFYSHISFLFDFHYKRKELIHTVLCKSFDYDTSMLNK